MQIIQILSKIIIKWLILLSKIKRLDCCPIIERNITIKLRMIMLDDTVNHRNLRSIRRKPYSGEYARRALT